MSDTWTDRASDPRPQGQPVDELPVLRQYLTHYRMTLEMKCEGLDAEQLARRSVPPSSLSLLGLVRHLAVVEQYWFRHVLQGLTVDPLYADPDDRDWELTSATGDPAMVEESFRTWRHEVEAADSWLDTLSPADLGSTVTRRDGEVAVRDVVVHMIEEYARHVGHADLLRECIDGRTGQ
ncbi:MAG: DinB family protein [Micrococcales bacterium]|uniref:DinB family protein n=1 Tax=Phycicoccus sp. TaxID=1902410 RepID=UPI0019C1D47E|nr:DinB family protein [Phycicoccus sp.]MBD3783282.1 DinB family protein [Micrococcales bacterium]HMM93397.1 DinB family protein [Phycicoccus sp.]